MGGIKSHGSSGPEPEVLQIEDDRKDGMLKLISKKQPVGMAKGLHVSLRHATALALVGWYLMIPPKECVGHLCRCPYPGDGCYITEQNAPLGRWQKWKLYNSGSECESALTAHVVEKYWKGNIYGRCIESDDSRLKLK
jgi:hypothetical protein